MHNFSEVFQSVCRLSPHLVPQTCGVLLKKKILITFVPVWLDCESSTGALFRQRNEKAASPLKGESPALLVFRQLSCQLLLQDKFF